MINELLGYTYYILVATNIKNIIRIAALVLLLFQSKSILAQCCKAFAGSNKTFCCSCVTIGGSPAATDTCSRCDSVLYRWSPSTGLNNANIANPCASPSQTTTYTLTVYAINKNAPHDTCCTSKSTVKVTVTANCCRMGHTTQQAKEEEHFGVYPNPAVQLINLVVNRPLINGQVEVYDVGGKLIWQKLGVFEGILEIDLSGNAKGLYFIKVKEGDTPVYSQKILLQNP
ncbi:MAG: T9SS type A sorting domain-containing protein [Bacteroidia bacterium]